ncbi:MAG TPA: hypothetical protein VKW76_12405 [Candidatus Binatia bacterium]|nr:hypothetical protein [Candidatus Binatia bacterium]
MRRLTTAILLAIAALGLPRGATAGCGCNKPPPPYAAVRPFVGYRDATVTLFDPRLVPGAGYWVQFVARADGSSDMSRGHAEVRRDLADGQYRTQLRVGVGTVALGPCAIAVYDDTGALVYGLGDDQLTITAPPIALHDFAETVVREGYQAGVGADGTIYVAVDVSTATAATTFTAAANGLPLVFEASQVAMYNMQGFLMQLMDPTVPGLFQIGPGLPLTSGGGPAPAAGSTQGMPAGFVAALLAPVPGQEGNEENGTSVTSDVFAYWRHDFALYKQQHRQLDAFRLDDDPDWHADGSYHVDHNTIVVAVRGTFADGTTPAPGATPPLRLVVTSSSPPLQ